MTAIAPIFVPPHLSAISGCPNGWDWWPQQQALVDRVVNSPKKVVLLQAEPGIGKTIMAWAIIKTMNRRGLVLVHTRQLERQYTRDFSDVMLMEGRRNYTCNISHRSAEFAPCSIGIACQLKKFGCNYYSAKRRASMAPMSVHNYAYWLSETKYNPESMFSSMDVIVCDEAHNIQSVLMESEVIAFEYARCKRMDIGDPPDNLTEILHWASQATNVLNAKLDTLIEKAHDEGLPLTLRSRDEAIVDGLDELGIDTDFSPTEGQQELIREIRDIDGMLTNLYSVFDIEIDDEGVEWIIDAVTDKRGVFVRPIFGKRGFKRILEASRRKVVLMSAYLAPELLIENLDIPRDDVEIVEAERAYDRSRSKVYYTPVVRMNYQTTDLEWRRVVKVIDAIIDAYAPKSGMIHVPSVKLRNAIRALSKHRAKIISYDGANHPDRQKGAFTKDEAIEQFKTRKGQRILLGQSISTGVDIPYVPEFNIIVKVPFPPVTDPVTKARMKVDKAYLPFLTICEIVQAMGRGKRAHDHECDTFILDRQFGDWFYQANLQHFPNWFTDNFVRNGWKAKDTIRKSLFRSGVVVR